MESVVDEKYRIAAAMRGMPPAFALDELARALELAALPQAMYTVLGELIDTGLVEVSLQPGFEYVPETLAFRERLAPQYRVVPEKRDDFGRYIEDLDKARFRPEANGRPRGRNYRVVEGYVEEFAQHPQKLGEERGVFEQYLALAEGDEVADRQSDPAQRAISEAFLRRLYAEYLVVARREGVAVLQLLLACRLFGAHGLTEDSRAADHRACEVLLCASMEVAQAEQEARLWAPLREGMERVRVGEGELPFALVFLALAQRTGWLS